MQHLAQCEEFVVKITMNRVFLTTPPPPRIGTSHGGLGDFGSELTKNTPVPSFGASHRGFVMDWCMETTPVSPEDTVSFICGCRPF